MHRLRSLACAGFALCSSVALAACGARTVGLSVDDFDTGDGGPIDTGRADTNVDDTAVSDTEHTDTFVFDSGVPDTSFDTFIDTSIDSGRIDTGTTDTGTIDTGVVDSGFDSGPPDVLGYPAPHPPAPKVVSEGGRVLASAKLVPIVFEGDAWAGDITKFVDTMGSSAASSWWSAVGGEYGVGTPTAAPLITVHETPPTAITNDEIVAWLSSKLDGTHADFGPPDTNAIYTIFYDYGTTITLAPGYDSCTYFGGYHQDATLASGVTIAYAVMPRCTAFVPGATDFEGMTAAASHEWIEASTDPFVYTDPSYLDADDDHLAWEQYPLTEVGDMCVTESTAFFFSPSIGYELQRTWSNVAAAASHDPCVPASGAAYFNSAPVLDDVVTIDLGDGRGARPTKGVHIPVLSSKTIELDLFSDAPTSGPWTLAAFDIGASFGGSSTLSFSFDRKTGVNGDKLHLTITATAAGPGGGSEFALRSQLGTTKHYWYGWVGN